MYILGSFSAKLLTITMKKNTFFNCLVPKFAIMIFLGPTIIDIEGADLQYIQAP